jgi:hypothetical protein
MSEEADSRSLCAKHLLIAAMVRLPVLRADEVIE